MFFCAVSDNNNFEEVFKVILSPKNDDFNLIPLILNKLIYSSKGVLHSLEKEILFISIESKFRLRKLISFNSLIIS